MSLTVRFYNINPPRSIESTKVSITFNRNKLILLFLKYYRFLLNQKTNINKSELHLLEDIINQEESNNSSKLNDMSNKCIILLQSLKAHCNPKYYKLIDFIVNDISTDINNIST